MTHQNIDENLCESTRIQPHITQSQLLERRLNFDLDGNAVLHRLGLKHLHHVANNLEQFNIDWGYTEHIGVHLGQCQDVVHNILLMLSAQCDGVSGISIVFQKCPEN